MYAPTAEPLKATGRDHAWALVHAPTKTNTASNSWTLMEWKTSPGATRQRDGSSVETEGERGDRIQHDHKGCKTTDSSSS